MNDVGHLLRKSSWWDGSKTMWCGAKFAANNVKHYWLKSVNCAGCKAAEKSKKN